MSKNPCVLGIDLGTTSVKVCLVDVKTQQVLASQKKDTYSDVPSELGKLAIKYSSLMSLHMHSLAT